MTDQQFAAMRTAMIDSQLRTAGVNDPRVLAAMGAVAREAFVPPARRAAAYIDRAVALAPGRALNPPATTGRLLAEADIRPGERVMVVGAGTGYCAALLAALGADVVAVEEDAALLAEARSALGGDVAFVVGPPAAGAPGAAPFAAIIVDGAIEAVPDALVDQLADGGRILFAAGEGDVSRLTVGRKSGGAIGYSTFADAEAAVLPGFARPAGFAF